MCLAIPGKVEEITGQLDETFRFARVSFGGIKKEVNLHMVSDANLKFKVNIPQAEESKLCIAGKVLKGIKKHQECPEFGKKCIPQNPLRSTMVSSEGACAAYYHFSNL